MQSIVDVYVNLVKEKSDFSEKLFFIKNKLKKG